MPAPARRPSSPFDLVPHGRWALVAYAFCAGLLLFVLVWNNARQREAARVDPVQPVAVQPAFDPLPAPATAGAATPLPAADESAQVVEVEQAPPVAPQQPLPPLDPGAPLPPSIDTAPVEAAAVQPPVRLPDQPAPRYPASALRRGESGTVVVQVEVGVDGHPSAISVAQRSGSRDLDRAAVEAVAGWRFEPARDAAGQAVAGSLSIPIDFKSQ